MNLADVLSGKRVVVTVGAGGVGKTTLAASIGLYYAITGKRVMVVTIDPAKRLAVALGLKEIGGEPHRIDLTPIHKSPRGSLDVMMLDPSEVFRSLIKRSVSSPERQQRVLNNRFFQRFTAAMGGTQEHAAVEKLFDLVEHGDYDLIVLDTPPSRHAIEFLSAPTRLLNVLDDSVVRWLVKPAKGGMSVFSFGSRYISKVLSYFAGADMLRDLAEYISLLSGEMAGFRDRAARVDKLLKDPSTLYLTIAGPERHAIEGALMFHRALAKGDYTIGASVVNRVWQVPEYPLTADALHRSIRRNHPDETIPVDFSRRIFNAYIQRSHISQIHASKLSAMKNTIGDAYPVFAVPAFVDELVDLPTVFRLTRALFTAGEVPQTNQ